MKKTTQAALKFIAPPDAEGAEPTALDPHFARLMAELDGGRSAELEVAAQVVSAWHTRGHICVPLSTFGVAGLAEKLRATRVVGAPGEMKPLILDQGGRLYLQRYWAYETSLAGALTARLRVTPCVDAARLEAGLARYFGEDAKAASQRAAAQTAVEKSFAVITGGPGTGKTRTVVVVLALLIEQLLAQGRVPRIALAAPTGKAGARMKESIQATAATLPLDDAIRAAMPDEATTLHRLLGTVPNSPYFRHDAARPLALDAVIVDEASMVDLAMMAKLVAALPAETRVILLGDKDQLASVDAGFVLGDICDASGGDAPIAGHIAELTENYRFQNDSGIYRLSRHVNAGAADAALELLRGGAEADARGAELPSPAALAEALRARVIEGCRGFLEATDPREALLRLGEFRILCALRKGPFGVENLNRLAEEALTAAGLIDPASVFYRGRPVLIRRNAPQLKLFNGDVGLLLPDAEVGGAMRAFFLDAAGELRRLLPARLPEHETVFAMTVHKSQGSEFQRVLLVLPERENAVVTRELVYTGITRASRAVEVWYREPALRAAIGRRVERSSGLREALWGASTVSPSR